LGAAIVLTLLLAVGAQAPPALSTEELDAKLAKVFESTAGVLLTIEDRIALATKARGGIKPTEIVISVSRIQVTQQNEPSYNLPLHIPYLVLKGAASADLIVMATPESVRVLPNQNRRFLFSQYTIRISRIFSDDPRGLSPGQTVIASVSGGSLDVDGVLVRAVDPAFGPIRLHEPYLFMLKEIPGTGTFAIVIPWTWEIKGGIVSMASKIQPGSAEYQKQVSEFIADIENAVAYVRTRRK
jgi:hypothetical protein